jgi:phosphoglycerol transferase MdoB-like AlkP superfamily enzyme
VGTERLPGCPLPLDSTALPKELPVVNSTLNRLSAAKFWLLTLMGLAALVLVVVNVVMANGNQSLRQEANQRQQYINQSIGIGRLHNQLVQALARLAVQAPDDALLEMLERHGINVSVRQQQAAPAEKPTATTPTEPADDQ